MAWINRLAAAALAPALAACTLATGAPPTVDVLAVRLTGVGLPDQQLALTLCVSNPNAGPLVFQRVTADLDVAGLPLATAASGAPVRLPGRSSSVVPFDMTATVQSLGPQLLAIMRSGAIDYRVHGTVALQGMLGLELPYSRSGHLDLLTGGLALASAVNDPTPSRCVQAAGPGGPG